MNLLRLTQAGSLILAPAGHMRPGRVIRRMLPATLICLGALAGTALITREIPGWASSIVYFLAFMIITLSLITSVAMVFAQGTKEVPRGMKNEVLLLALHGGRGKGRRSACIHISDEQYDLMRRLLSAQEEVRQADIALDHAQRSRTRLAPGLPHAYRQQVEAREDAVVKNAEVTAEQAQAALHDVRAEVNAYLDKNDLDEETCEFWQRLWHKGRVALHTWDEAY